MKKMKFFFVITIAILLFTSCNRQPKANFDIANNEVYEGEEVIFINESEKGKSFFWDFDDSHSSTKENPIHTYERYGVYTVSLDVYSKNEKKEDNYLLNVKVKNKLRQKILGTWDISVIKQEVYSLSTNELEEIDSDTFEIEDKSFMLFQEDSKLTGKVHSRKINSIWSITPDDKIVLDQNNPAEVSFEDNKMKIDMTTIIGQKKYKNYYYLFR